MTGRFRSPSALALLILTACSHPMIEEDDQSVALQPSPVASPAASPSASAAAAAGAGARGAPAPAGVTAAGPASAVPAPFDTEHVRFNLDPTVWKKISDDDGIQAYERREGKNPYGDVVAFRGETVIPASLIKIATVLDTPELQKEWVDSLEENLILEKISDFESIGYNKTGVPWPFQDRDFVFRANVKVQLDPPVMLIQMKSIEDPRKPPRDGIVRGEMLISYFYLKELADRQTRMVIEMAVDPKGAIPLWLVNAAQKKWPSNTLKKLREISLRESIPVSKKIEDYFKRPKTKGGKKK